MGEVEAGKLVILPLKEEILETSVSMIWHKNKWLSPALTEFMETAREVISQSAGQWEENH